MVVSMEKGPNQTIPPLRIIPTQSNIRYSISPRGFIFFLLAIFVLFLGIIGYLEYDRLVKPYMREFLCCLPAIILSGLLFFFGFATKLTTVRQVKLQRPGMSRTDDRYGSSSRLDKEKIIDVETIEPKRSDKKTGMSEGISGLDDKKGLRKYEPETVNKSELLAQKQNLIQFLKNLDEQHEDGLIMDGVYLGLKNKYKHELMSINNRLKKNEKGNIKIKKYKKDTIEYM